MHNFVENLLPQPGELRPMPDLKYSEVNYNNYSSVFDKEWYHLKRPDVEAAGLDPIEHYLEYGANENCDPHPLFDGRWYLGQHPEVRDIGLNPLTHYLTEGALFGYSPHPLFDGRWYLSDNPDVVASGLNPLSHYLTHGASEGRNPHPLFDSTWYLGQNPDVASAGLNPLVHYVTHGIIEGREPHPLFNSDWYRKSASIINTDIKYPVHHFMLYGASNELDPNPLFNVRWYILSNTDLDFSQINPLLHYMQEGWREGRDPHPLFNTKYYIDSHNEVNFENVNPLTHFLYTDIEKLADPNPLFECQWYLLTNQDVLAERLNPLVHYVHHGARQGRKPNRIFFPDWYLKHYPEAASSQLDALSHYLHFGVQKNYKPTSNFDPGWYLSQYDDVRASGMLPLEHFLKIGAADKRDCIDSNFYYRLIVAQDQFQLIVQVEDIIRHLDTMLVKPFFYILVDGDNNAKLEATKTSLHRQIYRNWKLVIRDNLGLVSDALLADRCNIFVWLCGGDKMHPHALYEYASAINSFPKCDIFYTDEDGLDIDGQRVDPFYKPDWSPDYLESINYIGCAAAFRGQIAAKNLLNSASQYDYVLRTTERADYVHHISKILLHCLPRFVGGAADIMSDCGALERRLTRTGRHGRFASIISNERCYKALLTLKDRPKISIIIPTAGRSVETRGEHSDLIRRCVELIYARSSYKNFEILIVHGGDLSGAQVNYLSQYANCLVCDDGPEFNISKKLNLGASRANGKYLMLLQDNIEPLSSDWMERMLFQLQKPHVGVVGAALFSGDCKPQHLGVVTNSGEPYQVRRGVTREEKGYFYSSCSTRNFSAVTGACMLTSRGAYLAVGGYSEDFAVSCSDIDYCFKLRDLGLTVVLEPTAQLVQYQPKPQVASCDPVDQAVFQVKWAHILERDPYYNEDYLTSEPPTFKIRADTAPIFEDI